jgi:hypothetical protein
MCFKIAAVFPSYRVEEVLNMPLAKVIFLHTGIMVLEGKEVVFTDIDEETKEAMQFLDNNKETLGAFFDEVVNRGTN